MPNSWGTALPACFQEYNDLSVGGNVTLAAGVKTTIFGESGVLASEPGLYQGLFLVSLNVSLGATPPGALAFAINLNGGSDIDSTNAATGLLVANGKFNFFACLSTSTISVPVTGSGLTFNVTGLSTLQPTTILVLGSQLRAFFFRAE